MLDRLSGIIERIRVFLFGRKHADGDPYNAHRNIRTQSGTTRNISAQPTGNSLLSRFR